MSPCSDHPRMECELSHSTPSQYLACMKEDGMGWDVESERLGWERCVKPVAFRDLWRRSDVEIESMEPSTVYNG